MGGWVGGWFITCAGGSIEENPAPGLALPHEQLGEFDGENDCFFEGFLGGVQAWRGWEGGWVGWVEEE